MMHTAMSSQRGDHLGRPPSRGRLFRKRVAGLLVIALMAGSGALLITAQTRGVSGLTHAEATPTGPFSYFPH